MSADRALHWICVGVLLAVTVGAFIGARRARLAHAAGVGSSGVFSVL